MLKEIDFMLSPNSQQYLNFLNEFDTYTKEDIESYQLDQLKLMITHCYNNVPYYRELFNKLSITSESFTTIKDIIKIPLLSKEIINSRYEDFSAQKRFLENRNIKFNYTSGSSGTPLKLVTDEDFRQSCFDQTLYYMKNVGLDPFNYKSIRLRGEIIDSTITEKAQYWIEEGANKLIMSSRHIDPSTVSSFVKKINSFQPDYIHAFPSVLYLLAQYIEKFDLKLNLNLICIFTDAERLFPNQREVIERVFNTPIHNVYAQTECVVRSTTCNCSNKLHIMPQIGITELIDENGDIVDTPGKIGEIIGTGFTNKVMPLLRYRTMDYGVYTEQECACGRNFLLLDRVEGRLRQYVVDKNNNIVTMFEYNKFTNVTARLGLFQYQIFQNEPGKLEFRYIPENIINISSFNEVKNYLSEEIRMRVGNNFTIKFKRVKEINKTKNGKYLFLDQKLNTSQYI